MSLPERTKGAVNGHCARLRSKYDGFRVTGDTVELPREEFDAARDRARDGYIGGASAFVHDGDRLLLVQTRDTADAWCVPGTAMAGVETLETTAARAVRDHTDVRCSVRELFQVRRRQTVAVDDPDGPALHSLWALFDADYETGTPTPADESVTDAAWWSRPPDAVHTSAQSRVREWASEPNRATR
jgi:ADP-ribose pyrophosphatase YjhB (NUDIX family)